MKTITGLKIALGLAILFLAAAIVTSFVLFGFDLSHINLN